MSADLRKELAAVLNKHSCENIKLPVVEVRIGKDSVRVFHGAAELGEKGDFEDVAYEDNSASNACYLLGLMAKAGIIKLRIKSRVKNEISYTRLLKGEPQ